MPHLACQPQALAEIPCCARLIALFHRGLPHVQQSCAEANLMAQTPGERDALGKECPRLVKAAAAVSYRAQIGEQGADALLVRELPRCCQPIVEQRLCLIVL